MTDVWRSVPALSQQVCFRSDKELYNILLKECYCDIDLSNTDPPESHI